MSKSYSFSKTLNLVQIRYQRPTAVIGDGYPVSWYSKDGKVIWVNYQTTQENAA